MAEAKRPCGEPVNDRDGKQDCSKCGQSAYTAGALFKISDGVLFGNPFSIWYCPKCRKWFCTECEVYRQSENTRERLCPVCNGIMQPNESKCFIATAVLGPEDADKLTYLQDFRDRLLLRSTIEAMFVKAYYWLSPPLARWVSTRPRVRRIIRKVILSPVILMINRGPH